MAQIDAITEQIGYTIPGKVEVHYGKGSRVVVRVPPEHVGCLRRTLKRETTGLHIAPDRFGPVSHIESIQLGKRETPVQEPFNVRKSDAHISIQGLKNSSRVPSWL